MDRATDHAALPESFHLAAGKLALDPRDPSFFQNPYPAYRALIAAGGTAHWEAVGGLAVAGHALVSAMLRDRRFGRVVPSGPDGRADPSGRPAHLADFYALEANSLLELEAPTHTRLRALLTKAFVSRRIERLAPTIGQIADALIDGFQDGAEIDLIGRFAAPLPVMVIADLIGVPRSAGDALVGWSHAMVAMYTPGRSLETEHAANHASWEFAAFLHKLIAAKARAPGDDLVSALIAAETEGGGRLSRDETVSLLVLLLNAGHEATVHQIGNAVNAILRHVGHEARGPAGQSPAASPAGLFADAALAEATVEETLRFDPPLHLFERYALEPVELPGGARLERGDKVALLLAAANRDPAAYSEPDRFIPARFLGTNPPTPVSFGGGIHFCIGAPLARLEMKIALTRLFTRCPDIFVAAPPPVRDAWHFRGLESLLVATARQEHGPDGPR
ncbi:cytochrome P450 [Jiella sonneratiae]|uniref:Cytochrome P450 n=1 Tax=Jiella sonneratiae TaxID=2816856 RepID=A0ABS3IZ91_9HYPH|nr:cytochrome P450 [Jiella sonneratiae]MBO0902734.1 cytochrome P450 [Jiella sonneratiae]